MRVHRFNFAAFIFLALECVVVYAWTREPVYIWLTYGFLAGAAFNLVLSLWGDA